WQQELVRLSARLHLSRPVLLLESALADAPVVLGHLRPLILVPAGLLAGLPPQQIEAILLHELAHIRRHDYLVNLLQRFAECLLFYHPAAWWISRVIGAERENCCDDLAVSLSGDAHQYASALAALEQNRCSGREPAVAATGGSLVKRIRRLLKPQARNGAWAPLGAAMILVATAALSFGAWQANTGAIPNRYAKWLNQDVAYIITAQERAAFQKLTTDEERNQFIRQFWQRRNPPGAPEGAFKQEHYRRRAFANKHFVSSEPGWKTDRGHIYIVYGPPDEIESHPSTAQHRYPTQVWMYRHVKGLGNNRTFTFVDFEGPAVSANPGGKPFMGGDYRLAPSAQR
ncbi:MAG: GWxTD domain-containing protein, partial [Bryobacteraceae bacterium]